MVGQASRTRRRRRGAAAARRAGTPKPWRGHVPRRPRTPGRHGRLATARRGFRQAATSGWCRRPGPSPGPDPCCETWGTRSRHPTLRWTRTASPGPKTRTIRSPRSGSPPPARRLPHPHTVQTPDPVAVGQARAEPARHRLDRPHGWATDSDLGTGREPDSAATPAATRGCSHGAVAGGSHWHWRSLLRRPSSRRRGRGGQGRGSCRGPRRPASPGPGARPSPTGRPDCPALPACPPSAASVAAVDSEMGRRGSRRRRGPAAGPWPDRRDPSGRGRREGRRGAVRRLGPARRRGPRRRKRRSRARARAAPPPRRTATACRRRRPGPRPPQPSGFTAGTGAGHLINLSARGRVWGMGGRVGR
jgi:hypothetical protein